MSKTTTKTIPTLGQYYLDEDNFCFKIVDIISNPTEDLYGIMYLDDGEWVYHQGLMDEDYLSTSILWGNDEIEDF